MRKRSAAIVVAILVVLVVAVFVRFPVLALRLAESIELHAAGLRRASVEVGGDHVAYLIGGSGEPLLLLHGFGADKSSWVRVAKHLTPHFSVVAPDLPGFGESTRDPDARYGIADQVDRVHAFAAGLGLPPLDIGGNSMGGAIAGAYAARFPGEVKHLWLLAPGGVRSAKRSELDEMLARGENPLLVNDADGFERLLDFVFVERPSIPRPIERYLAEQAIAHRAFNDKILHELFAGLKPLEDELRGSTTPTLILWGDHDRLVDVSGAQVLKSVMPNAEVVVMANVGHVPMIEKPAKSAAAFIAFRSAH
jgi:pimeloyl-ACP methyl ester carboxylesterase